MHERELEVALDAARRASQYLMQEYARFQVVPDAPANITTEADRQSQEIILQTIRAAFPHDALCAEEATATLQGSVHIGARLWIVDPIDGTRGFARKNGEFSVMLGFVENGQIGVGVVAQPAVGRLTYAVRGAGCWRKDGNDPAPTRCLVTTIDALPQCTLTQSRSRDPNKPSHWVAYWDVFTGSPRISFLWMMPVSLVASLVCGCLFSLIPTRGRSAPAIARNHPANDSRCVPA